MELAQLHTPTPVSCSCLSTLPRLSQSNPSYALHQESPCNAMLITKLLDIISDATKMGEFCGAGRAAKQNPTVNRVVSLVTGLVERVSVGGCLLSKCLHACPSLGVGTHQLIVTAYIVVTRLLARAYAGGQLS